jgi:hypothetical protein
MIQAQVINLVFLNELLLMFQIQKQIHLIANTSFRIYLSFGFHIIQALEFIFHFNLKYTFN